MLVAEPWVKLSVLRETSSPSVCLFFYDFSERQDCHIGSVSSPPSQFRSAHGFLKKRLHGIPDSALPSLQVIHLIYHGVAILGTIEKNQSLSFLSFLCLLYGLLSTSGIPVLGIMVDTADMQVHLQRSRAIATFCLLGLDSTKWTDLESLHPYRKMIPRSLLASPILRSGSLLGAHGVSYTNDLSGGAKAEPPKEMWNQDLEAAAWRSGWNPASARAPQGPVEREFHLDQKCRVTSAHLAAHSTLGEWWLNLLWIWDS